MSAAENPSDEERAGLVARGMDRPGRTSSTGNAAVGLIANAAAGRDIRRLVAVASMVDNAEKARRVLQLLAGLGASGVERVVMMPAGDIGARLGRGVAVDPETRAPRPFPVLDLLDMPLRDSAQDTTDAVAEMRRQRVGAIVVLGGDGTHRAVAKASGDTPLCALSTGTNNAFPEPHDPTVAGIASGLVATGRLGAEVLRREKVLHLNMDGDPFTDCAVADVASTTERFLGTRALWKPESIREFVVPFASSCALGLVGIAGLLERVPREARYGLHVRLTETTRAPRVLTAPLAPGLPAEVGVAEYRRVWLGEPVALEAGAGTIAIDGEREIELSGHEQVEVRLGRGPVTIDIDTAMRQAAQRDLMVKTTCRRFDQSGQREAVA